MIADISVAETVKDVSVERRGAEDDVSEDGVCEAECEALRVEQGTEPKSVVVAPTRVANIAQFRKIATPSSRRPQRNSITLCCSTHHPACLVVTLFACESFSTHDQSSGLMQKRQHTPRCSPTHSLTTNRGQFKMDAGHANDHD